MNRGGRRLTYDARLAGAVHFHRIRITEGAVEEVEGKVAVVSIPRREIRAMRIVIEARVSEHPILMWGLGVAAVASGVLALVMLQRGVLLRFAGGFLVFAAFSPKLFAAALRRGAVVVVDTDRGRRKLAIGTGIAPAELDDFVALASGIGCTIAGELPVAEVVAIEAAHPPESR